MQKTVSIVETKTNDSEQRIGVIFDSNDFFGMVGFLIEVPQVQNRGTLRKVIEFEGAVGKKKNSNQTIISMESISLDLISLASEIVVFHEIEKMGVEVSEKEKLSDLFIERFEDEIITQSIVSLCLTGK